MQRAQAAEARVEALNAQSRQQRSHPVHAQAQLEEASARFGDAASMQDASLVCNPADAQLISQVDCPAVALCHTLMLIMHGMSEASLAVLPARDWLVVQALSKFASVHEGKFVSLSCSACCQVDLSAVIPAESLSR